MTALCKGEHGKSGHQYKDNSWWNTAIISGRNVNISDKNEKCKLEIWLTGGS